MLSNLQFPADLVTFTEEIVNGNSFCVVFFWIRKLVPTPRPTHTMRPSYIYHQVTSSISMLNRTLF